MPSRVTDVDTLQEYISGVMNRADHHANGVIDVCLTIAGAIIWKKDPGTDIEVFVTEGTMRNVLWVWINRTRYAFSYYHPTASIHIRRNTTQGDVLHELTNNHSAQEIRDVFNSL